MGKTSKPAVVEKDEQKVGAAVAATQRRASSKKAKGQMKYFATVGGGTLLVVLTLYLSVTGGSKRGGGSTSKLDSLVNDDYFIKTTNDNADGNFSAAASPFFDRWTHADLRWGLQGISLSNMVGMAGAVQRCDESKDMEGGALPREFDLRQSFGSCFVGVRNSGNCTGSYAIAAATAVSLRYCVSDMSKFAGISLSPQQVLSCDKRSRGCAGGGADGVWSYIQRRGLYPEKCLPYVGKQGVECKTDCKEDEKLKILNHCVLSGSLKGIKREIFNKGPVVAPMHLTSEFLVYKEGVFQPTPRAVPVFDANGKPVVHVVTLIGWGKSDGQDFWLIENSWGKDWGENGFAKVVVGGVLREDYLIAGYPATPEAIAEHAKKEEEDKMKQEERKRERAERDERIAERKRLAEEERRAAAESEEDDAELDVDLDEDLDVDFEDVDADLEVNEDL